MSVYQEAYWDIASELIKIEDVFVEQKLHWFGKEMTELI